MRKSIKIAKKRRILKTPEWKRMHAFSFLRTVRIVENTTYLREI